MFSVFKLFLYYNKITMQSTKHTFFTELKIISLILIFVPSPKKISILSPSNVFNKSSKAVIKSFFL